MIAASWACLVLFIASCLLLGAAGIRISGGRETFGFDSPKRGAQALLVQTALLLLSSFAVYSVVGGEYAVSLTILFVVFVLGVPLALATCYYVAVFGGFLGRSIYAPDVMLPGTEIPELDRARALVHRGDLEGAAARAGEFLAGHPANIDALRFLAGLELRRGNFDRAAGLCRRALQADAEVRATRTGLAEEERVRLLALLADAFERGGRGAEAAEAIEENLSLLTTERFRRTLSERAARLRGEGDKVES